MGLIGIRGDRETFAQPAVGLHFVILLAMTNGHLLAPEHPAQALGWLDVLATLMPETVKLEVSGYLLIVALLALWIWRRPPPGS